jgi:alanyl-tRNA synthetase
MGLERIAAVMQGVHDNYDTDTFKALIACLGRADKTKAEGDNQASHRVIADHLRASGFLLADGVFPANEGRGYVLRRIMRRGNAPRPSAWRERSAHAPPRARAGRRNGRRLSRACPCPAGDRSDPAPGRSPVPPHACQRPAPARRSHRQDGTGRDASRRHRIQALRHLRLPYDLTEDALRARGLAVDRAGFDAAMAEQKAAARAAWKGSGEAASDDLWYDLAEEVGSTEFTGYSSHEGEGVVLALVKDGKRVDQADSGETVTVILNQTPFYGESGGQVGDAGKLTALNGFEGVVEDTSKPLGRLHALRTRIAQGSLKVGDTLHQSVDVERRNAVRANHSATHLLHAALRHRLGQHVTQKGSLVAPDRLRFDFSHPTALSPDDIAAIEAEVNAHIRHNHPVTTA